MQHWLLPMLSDRFRLTVAVDVEILLEKSGLNCTGRPRGVNVLREGRNAFVWVDGFPIRCLALPDGDLYVALKKVEINNNSFLATERAFGAESDNEFNQMRRYRIQNNCM